LQTMSDSTADLNASVAALQDGNQVLNRASQLAQEGINATSEGQDYEALASEVDGLINRVLSTANSQSDGRYLFGGTATTQPPFSVTTQDAQGRPTAVTYAGSAERSNALIGPGQTVDTHYAGSQVFQQPGADVFQSLIGLRDDLRNANLDPNAKAKA